MKNKIKRINDIEEAMELIVQAQELVDNAINNTEQQNHYESYGKYGFNQLLGNGNPYDFGLPKLIEEIREED